MIKTFEYAINGQPAPFCATVGGDADATRVMISTADSPETLVIMEVSGALSAMKVRLESTEEMLDEAIEKVRHSGLIERALDSGEIQTGKL